jgi:hypothetical protein
MIPPDRTAAQCKSTVPVAAASFTRSGSRNGEGGGEETEGAGRLTPSVDAADVVVESAGEGDDTGGSYGVSSIIHDVVSPGTPGAVGVDAGGAGSIDSSRGSGSVGLAPDGSLEATAVGANVGTHEVVGAARTFEASWK